MMMFINEHRGMLYCLVFKIYVKKTKPGIFYCFLNVTVFVVLPQKYDSKLKQTSAGVSW